MGTPCYLRQPPVSYIELANPVKGSGFPLSLFNDNASYPLGSGGAPTNSSASKWWTKWWNNAIIDNRGLNGWALQVEFLQNIIKTVENHTSTLGYEILNEPRSTA